jgi:capsid portal protein
MGSWKANMVNYDLFDNQGIPPLIISVAGGSLTDDSFNDLVSLLRRSKGMKNFNRLLVLEMEGVQTGADGRESIPRLSIQNMSESRKEDAMFLRYLQNCNAEVQKLGFRLPGMFLGISDDANFATAFIVRKMAEEQIFVPERARFDEIINRTIVKDLLTEGSDLCFQSNGPTLQSVENLPQILALLVSSGVFTVNGLISFVNSQFGLRIALYEGEDAAWADEPIKAMPAPPNAENPQEKDALVEEEVRKNQKIYTALKEIERTAMNIGTSGKKGCAHAA